MDRIISFPHIGNYHIPIARLLRALFDDAEVRAAPPITRKTLALGGKYSPDFACVPFKYNLGNFIESLEAGANTLIQAGGGCRYGYYGEVQEQILRDLGYDFEFVQLLSGDLDIRDIYKTAKRLNDRLTPQKFIYSFLLAAKMVDTIDRIEQYIRENIGFETEKNSFIKLHGEFLSALGAVEDFSTLHRVYRTYGNAFRELAVVRPESCLKVGMVGELYTLMEPFSNFFMEKELAKYGMLVSRYTTISYLLFKKPLLKSKILKEAGAYLKFPIGADGTDSVAKSRSLAERGYDGIIHVKPFGCTPEVNAMPMLQKIGRDYAIPILYFSFDAQTSETGIRTRLEAFADMIRMRREKGFRAS